jgi:hypothetical protein
MSNVKIEYSPPRLFALVFSSVFFTSYQSAWLPELQWNGFPVSLPFAIGFSLILGYAIAMLCWLLMNTRAHWFATFSPTRGRVISAFCLAAIAPIAVFDGLPLATGYMLVFDPDLPVMYLSLLIFVASYILVAMIVRHTYQRRMLRLGLFMLCYWAAIAFLMLWKGRVTLFLPPIQMG